MGLKLCKDDKKLKQIQSKEQNKSLGITPAMGWAVLKSQDLLAGY